MSPSQMLSTVTFTSPIPTSTLSQSIRPSSSLGSRLSIAVAPSIWIYEVLPPSEVTVCLAISSYIWRANLMTCVVHCHLFCTLWGFRVKCLIICKSMLGILAWYRRNSYRSLAHTVLPLQLTRCAWISSLSNSYTCFAQLELSVIQILHLPH